MRFVDNFEREVVDIDVIFLEIGCDVIFLVEL